jgi:hypothetical protein
MLILHFYRSSDSNTWRKPHLLGCFSGSHCPNELAIFGILASWSAYRSVTIISILGQALHLVVPSLLSAEHKDKMSNCSMFAICEWSAMIFVW